METRLSIPACVIIILFYIFTTPMVGFTAQQPQPISILGFGLTKSNTIFAMAECMGTDKNNQNIVVSYKILKFENNKWIQLGSDILKMEDGSFDGFYVTKTGKIYIKASVQPTIKNLSQKLLYEFVDNKLVPIETFPLDISQINNIAFSSDDTLYISGTKDLKNSADERVVIAKREDGKFVQLGEKIKCQASRNSILALSPSNELYFAGAYLELNGKYGTLIKLNRDKWSAVGEALDADPSVLETDDPREASNYYPSLNDITFGNNNTIYISGVFNRSGEQKIFAVGRWDGTHWTTLKYNGIPIVDDHTVGVSMVQATDGSIFGIIANFPKSYFVKCKDNTCTTVSTDKYIFKNLAIGYDNTVYALGSIRTNTSSTPNSIMKWNGTKWEVLTVKLPKGNEQQTIKDENLKDAANPSYPSTIKDIKRKKKSIEPSQLSSATVLPDTKQAILGNWTGQFEMKNSNNKRYTATCRYNIYKDPRDPDKLKFKQTDSIKFINSSDVFSCSMTNSVDNTFEGDVVLESDNIKFIQKKVLNPKCGGLGVDIYRVKNDTLEAVNVNDGKATSGFLRRN